MINSIYPKRGLFSTSVAPNSMERFQYYSTKARSDRLDKIGRELFTKLERYMFGERDEHVDITLQAVGNIIENTETGNIGIFVESFLEIVELLLKQNSKQYVLEGAKLFTTYCKKHKLQNQSEEVRMHAEKYLFFSIQFSKMSGKDDEDFETMGLVGLDCVIHKICNDPGNMELKQHDSIVPIILNKYALKTDETKSTALQMLKTVCAKCDMINFKALLAQTINFLHTNGIRKESNFWQSCEMKYFGLKHRHSSKLDTNGFDERNSEQNTFEQNTMDVTDEDLIAYDIFCAIHEHSQEQFGPIIVQALICHADNTIKRKKDAEPSDPEISRITGIVVCIRLLTDQIRLSSIIVKMANETTKIVDMLEWSIGCHPKTQRLTDLLIKCMMQIAKGAQVYQRMDVCSLLVGRLNCQNTGLKSILLDCVYKISQNNMVTNCQNTPMINRSIKRISKQVQNPSDSEQSIKSTLIPPALIKQIMSLTSNFYDQERIKLIKILMNLLCSEQPQLFIDEIDPNTTDFSTYFSAHQNCLTSSSIDAFSRISKSFYSWLFETILLPDNTNEQLVQVYRLMVCCIRYFGSQASLGFTEQVFHIILTCQSAKEQNSGILAVTLAIAHAAASLGGSRTVWNDVADYTRELVHKRIENSDASAPGNLLVSYNGASVSTNYLMKVTEIVERVNSTEIVEKFKNPQLFHPLERFITNNDEIASNGSFKDLRTDTESVHSLMSRVYSNSGCRNDVISPEKEMIYEFVISDDTLPEFIRNNGNRIRRDSDLDSVMEDGISASDVKINKHRNLETIRNEIDEGDRKVQISMEAWLESI